MSVIFATFYLFNYLIPSFLNSQSLVLILTFSLSSYFPSPPILLMFLPNLNLALLMDTFIHILAAVFGHGTFTFSFISFLKPPALAFIISRSVHYWCLHLYLPFFNLLLLLFFLCLSLYIDISQGSVSGPITSNSLCFFPPWIISPGFNYHP